MSGQLHSLYKFNNVMDAYNIHKKTGMHSKEEFKVFFQKFNDIGLYPFSAISSLCFGLTKIQMTTTIDSEFIEKVTEWNDKFGKDKDN
jgi:hypothetical protein